MTMMKSVTTLLSFVLFNSSSQAFQPLSLPPTTSITHIHKNKHISKPSSSLSFYKTTNHYQSNAPTKTTTTTSLSMIFERMSEECISALVAAQNESARLGQPTVGTEIMTLGIIDRPENSKRTLKKYGVTLRKTKRTVEDMFQPDGDDSDSNNNGSSIGGLAGKMLNMNRKARDVELPFTPSLKKVLNSASKIADKMNYNTNGSIIRSEHVLLALFGWEEEVKETANAKLDKDGYAKGALAVFLQMEGLEEANFSATEFCKTLVMDLKEKSNEVDGDNGLQLVSGGRKGKDNTPTLNECGVDLTQAAENGELDDVHGRDEEIKACLRTLVRRRKNNPCLMGEPG